MINNFVNVFKVLRGHVLGNRQLYILVTLHLLHNLAYSLEFSGIFLKLADCPNFSLLTDRVIELNIWDIAHKKMSS